MQEKINAEKKLMKKVTDIDIESEKKFESLLAKQEEGISFNDEVLLSLKALHLELEEMSKKLDQLP